MPVSELNHQQFAQVLRYSALAKHQKPKDTQKPVLPKVHMSATEKCFFGDGTIGGELLALFLNVITLGIVHYCCLGGSDRLDTLQDEANQRANCVRAMGIDTWNESDQFDYLYRLPLDQLNHLERLVTEFQQHIPDDQTFNLTENSTELILYTSEQCELPWHLVIKRPDNKTDNKLGLYYRDADGDIPLLSEHEYKKVIHLAQIEKPLENKTLAIIRSKLSLEARAVFHPLFNTPTIGAVAATNPLVAGDTDGSTARMILLGIQAGKIDIEPRGIELLADVINAEAEVLNAVNQFGDKFRREQDNKFVSRIEAFQRNALIQYKLEELVSYLSFKSSDRVLRFIGDVSHDRFSNNKDIDRYIREQLFEQGVIFIRGNHDRYGKQDWEEDAQQKESNAEKSKTLNQWGYFAKDTASEADWKTHEHKVFVNAQFDVATKTLYVHHGLQKEGRSIGTGFSGNNQNLYPLPEYGQFDPTDFEGWINKIQTFRISHFTNFKPSDYAMRALAKELGIRIVHGHCGEPSDDQEYVIVLNSLMTNPEFHHNKHVAEKIRVVSAAYIGAAVDVDRGDVSDVEKVQREKSYRVELNIEEV